jgi:hypothetical protein
LKSLIAFLKNIFRPWPSFLLFNTQTMHIKSFYTQQHCRVSLKTLYPGGIRTQVFLFLRQMRCPLRHAARARVCFALMILLITYFWIDCPRTRSIEFQQIWPFILGQ